MAEYRTIRIGFWHDPYIEELDAKAKLLYIYLFTGPYANNLGVVEATRRKIAYETALSSAEVDKYLEAFADAGKVVCDHDHNLIFLTNFIRHQSSTSPKILDGLRKLAPSISSPIIAKAICIRYPDVYGVNKDEGEMISIPYANGIHNLCIPSGEVGSWKLEKGKGKEDSNESLQSAPDCPHDKIRSLFAEVLPTLPQARVWNEERQKALRARWREVWEQNKKAKAEGPHEESVAETELLAWWRGFFEQVKQSPWLMGQIDPPPGRERFLADLTWLTKKANFAKVIDGKYLPRRRAA